MLDVRCFLSFIAAVAIAGTALPAADSNSVIVTNPPAANPEPVPKTARDAFNAGTRKLLEGKLRESESLLQSSLAKQDSGIQPSALYNLGHVRFAQGTEELKRARSARPGSSRLSMAAQLGAQAIRAADAALADQDMQKMVAVYMQGRGVRKELRSATEAMRRALELYGSALRRWQRALGDFHSAAELDSSDTNSVQNAKVVERAIAKLVDSILEMQRTSNAIGQQEKQLAEQLKKLRGMIPKPMMPPGADGDEEEDGPDGDRPPPLPKPGEQEAPGKEGQEQQISAEQAGMLLEGFKLDGERRLPMGEGPEAPPKTPNRRNW